MSFNIAAVGLKGVVYFQHLANHGLLPKQIFSYPQSADDPYFVQLNEKAKSLDVKVINTKSPSLSQHLTFFIGWQFLVPGDLSKMIVFHDSLLPKYRGFAPTVAALINGESKIGVTAIRPVEAVDAGPILAQKSWEVSHPMEIAKALAQQATIMADITIELVERKNKGDALNGIAQKDSCATYSLWRDAEDYHLDFNESADRILRHIKAVGPPYEGALCYVKGKPVRIFDAEILPDLNFTNRQAGKIWNIANNSIEVVCGKGMLALRDMVDNKGRPWHPKSLRLRLKSTPH